MMTKELTVEIISMFEDGAEEVSILTNEDDEVISARRGRYNGHNWQTLSEADAASLIEDEGYSDLLG